ncbi:MAG: hypothetical protein JNL11_13310 [Bdellovibrionaceae bacterium]|nr:hypothetical protein [Pseudobdellovibrionaceae bacterium]
MANEKLILSEKLLLIPDATFEVTKRLPSLLLTSPDDSRIDKLASEKSEVFLVRIQHKTDDLVVIVDPKSFEGILWWKTVSRLVLTWDRWVQITKNESKLTDDELSFISKFVELKL